MAPADYLDIAAILKGQVPVGSRVTVRGWVRTRRDSKAGLSFVHLHDGSCFDPIQVVAPAQLPNYESEITEAHVGMCCRRLGHTDQEPGTGTGGRTAGRRHRGGRVGGRPRGVSHPAEEDVVRVPARGGAPAAADQHAWRGRASPSLPQHGHPPLLPRARVLLGAHADHHRERCGRRRRDVPREHARPRESRARCPRTPEGRDRLQPGLLRQGSVPDGQRPAECRNLLPGAVEGLHVRADVPRREQQHEPPPCRVLDGGARDRVRRSVRRRRPRRVVPQIHPYGAAQRARRRHEVLRRSHRQDVHRPG